MKNIIRHVCVLVPARNEEKLLASCLTSILQAGSLLDSSINFDIVLAVDASQDKTFQIGKNILKNKGTVVQTDKANVGHARKQAALTALNRCNLDTNECWIANTDADCNVPKNWLTDQLYHAYNGIQGITGIVKVDSYYEHGPMVCRKFTESYLINPDHSHPHVHGANIGFRADAYLKVGGWNELKTAEDHDLWDRFTHYGISKISDAKIWVYTSGRRIGRAPHGFADTLASHNEEQ